jgi:polyhydroxybutyrate depolymerase
MLFAPDQTQTASAAGCWPGKAHAAGSTDETIQVTGQGERRYRLHVPSSYNGADRTMLVLAFHGLGSNGQQTELYSGLSAFSDLGWNFIAAYPEGTENGFGQQYWNFIPTANPNDVLFTSELLDALETELCIDTNMVFSTGISNGGLFSYALACRLSGRIAAAAPVAATLLTDCSSARSVSILHVHGLDDENIPFEGGQGTRGVVGIEWPPVQDGIDRWRALNGCPAAAKTAVSGAVTTNSWSSCRNGTEVRLVTLAGVAHVWPKEPYAATPEIWRFLAAHPRR